jgi:hypothetical protein
VSRNMAQTGMFASQRRLVVALASVLGLTERNVRSIELITSLDKYPLARVEFLLTKQESDGISTMIESGELES